MQMSRSKAWIPICVSLLCTWEGMDLTAKHQRIDPAGVITYCIGRTNYDDPNIRAGEKFTKADCQKFLTEDVPRYNAMMHKCIPKEQPPHREAALTSFTYNLGQGAVCKSSVARLINEGRIEEGCDAMMRYDRANGKVLPGLQNRRRAEVALCKRND